MFKARWTIVLPVLLLASLACGLTGLGSDIKKIQDAATQLPGMLTSAPTLMGPLETAAAKYTPPAAGTPGMGGTLSLQNSRPILEMTQQFKFTDDTVAGQPVTTVKLTDNGAASFAALKDGFSATYTGDPGNLSQIQMVAPRSDAQDSVDQGIELDNLLLSGVVPPDVQANFVKWLTENYSGVAVSGKLDETIGSFQFTLERSDSTETLTIVPAK